MKVTIFDYGAGNLHSLTKAILADDVEVHLEADPAGATEADVLVLPGVGAFGPAAERLRPGRDAMRRALDAGLPCLGICLGMQLLFETSEEGDGAGLGVIPGVVTRLQARRVPHIGWNTLDDRSDPLLESASLSIAYFANGYACRPAVTDTATAWSTHEADRFPVVVRQGSILGVQFHPEKSSASGLRFIRAFLEGARV
jgi:glutamine amidotransferase